MPISFATLERIFQADGEELAVIKMGGTVPWRFRHGARRGAQTLYQVAELAQVHRLQEHEVRLDRQVICYARMRRDHHHRHVLEPQVCAHALEDLLTRNARQVQIQQDDVGLRRLQTIDGLASVQDDLGLIAGNVQHMSEQGCDVPVIFNDKCEWFIHG